MSPTTIFWPTDLVEPGFCFGWRRPALCVAGRLTVDTISEAKAAVEIVSALPEYRSLRNACGEDPVIFGKFTCERKQKITVPIFHFPVPKDYIVVYYYRHLPTTLRFYSLEALRLDYHAQEPHSASVSTEPSALDYAAFRVSASSPGINDIVVDQFNAANTVEGLLQNYLNPSEPLLKTDTLWTIFDVSWKKISPLLALFSNFLTAFCNAPILLSFVIKDISAIVQQIDVRAEQADFFAAEVSHLRNRGMTPTSLYSARYINFFNTVWLLLNDITIGSAIGSFLCDNHIVLASMLNSMIDNIFIRWIQWVLHWLDSWPAGLKLNTELSRFYSQTFIDLIAMWGRVLQWVAPHLPAIIYFFGVASWGGATFSISLFSDLLAILTAHIYVCYFVSNAVYARLLTTAGSLWNIFRGKRYNALRNRTDTWEYDIDQLLFGTILFTLLAFLFPTVLVYYSLFALLRLAIILVQACLETQLAFMNHFPLFALMLRVKDPWRLPGGIYFILERHEHGLVIKSQPVPFSSIFFQYIRLSSRLGSHYNPLRLLRRLLAGKLLEPIPRYSIRYSKSTEKREE
ncbi:Gpi1-domain-containing protein [Armillaria solidipes]|uniref:Gpi1-domain-containing protein n=1 Tax=Armillaria solidipes TaxID=1076256 RepID=A0A2H3AQC6_9AGAR|nr:Gpi1-domain-containing protein [Armillaria solidipes]